MDSKKLLRALRRKFNVPNDSRLAKIVGISQPNLAIWKNKSAPLTANQIANLAFNARNQGAKDANEKSQKISGVELVKSLKGKFGVEKNKTLASKLGINEASISGWKKSPLSSKKIASAIASAQKKGIKDSQKKIIKPLLEYYPLEVSESSHGKRQEIFKTKGNPRKIKIKELLKKTSGIYVFYNSQHKAIYVGQNKVDNLWREIKNAYNRTIPAQVVWGVEHPSTGNFEPKPRIIKKQKVQLHEIASYFSAYKVSKGAIDDIEALLIRTFANELTNTKMETFGSNK